MGIKDLGTLLRSKCPEAMTRVHLSHFHGKSIAMDVSVFIYRCVKSSGDDDWLTPMMRLLVSLKKFGIKVVAIYDGQYFPEEKKETQRQRREESRKIREKLEMIDGLMAIISEEYLLTDKPIGTALSAQVEQYARPKTMKAVEDPNNYETAQGCYSALEKRRNSLAKQCAPVTDAHVDLVKQMIELMGMTSLQAYGEAETLCHYLCKNGHVDAVLTEDSDLFVYGCPVVLTKIDPSDNTVVYTEHQRMLDILGMTHETFVDMCICLGCDYNKRVKGYGIVKVHALIVQHGSIEEIAANDPNFDPASLNYKRCRQLFTTPSKIYEEFGVALNRPLHPDLRKFMTDNNIRLRFEEVEEVWKPRLTFC